jgi:hypothetical protein
MSGSSSSGHQQGNNMYATSGSYNNAANSEFGQNVFQANALDQLYGQAGNLFGQTNRQSQVLTPGAINYQNQVAQNANAANQRNMQGGAYGGLNIGNQLMSSLRQSGSTPSATSQIYGQMMGGSGNNYADAMKASYISDANRAQKMMLGNLDARAAASGMSGGSRQGIAEALGNSDINRNLQQNLASTGYNTFDKDLQNKLNIAQQADQGTFNRQQLMSDMLGQQQGTANQGIANAGNIQGLGMGQFNAANSPWQGMQQYQSALGAPTILNQGSSSSTGKGASSGFGMGQSSGSSKSGGGGI